MATPERAQQILDFFNHQPGDFVASMPAGEYTNEELEYLLQHGDGDEAKNKIRQELYRRRSIGTWLLETVDGDPIYSDGEGHFSPVRDAKFYYLAEFVEDKPDNDDHDGRDEWFSKAVEQLGIDIKLVQGPHWTSEQLYG